MILTLEDLQNFDPNSVKYNVGLYYACDDNNINTPIRIAYFMSQVAAESVGFLLVEENLNYSAKALLETWSTRFTSETASQYAHQPEKIANYVYANRMGNGDEASGDGWNFRGRGLIQITGRTNYTNMSGYLNNQLILDTPEIVATDSKLAAESAGWFWSAHNLNQYADAGDFIGLTKAINGGLNGLAARQQWLAKAQQIWEF